MKITDIINEGKTGPGLWANINAKRKRGAKMRKKGAPGAPTEKALKAAQAGSKNESVSEEGPGLYANIRAKREHIKGGSGERMRKPGSKGAPTAKDFRDAASEGVAEGNVLKFTGKKRDNTPLGTVARALGTTIDREDAPAYEFEIEVKRIPQGWAVFHAGSKQDVYDDPETAHERAKELEDEMRDEQGVAEGTSDSKVHPVAKSVGIQPTKTQPKQNEYVAPEKKSSPAAIIHIKPRTNEGQNGEYDDEAGMAETNLHTIARAAKGLLDTIDSNENLPEWVQEKIAKVEGMMTSAWDYLESQEEQGVDPRQGVAEGMAGQVVFSGSGADGGKYEIIQTGPTDFMIHVNGKHIDTYSSLQRAMSVLKNEVPGLKKGVAEGSESKDNLIWTLNNFDYYTEDSKLYVNDKTGDKIIRAGSQWKHLKSGKVGRGAEELGEFLSSKQGAVGEQLEETYHDDDEFFEAYGVMEYNDEMINESEYQGRKVALNKPMQGDVKKFKVYVKNPKGNVVKVNFGQKGAKIKKNNPGRRKNFRARHNCDNPGPKTGARYWSCRKW